MGLVRGERIVLLLVCICASVGIATAALAQGYPPPTPTNVPTPTGTGPTPTGTNPNPTPTDTPRHNGCAVTGHLKKGKFHADTEFSPGDNIAVRGKKDCAKKEVNVTAKISEGAAFVQIGKTTSSDKGSYTVQGKVPAGSTFGQHTVRVQTSGRTYESDIDVVASTSSKNTSFGVTAGPLAAAWIALFGVVAAFVVARRRRRPLLMAMAVPETEVPMLDTSGFVPVVTKMHALGPRAKKQHRAKKAEASKGTPGGGRATTKRKAASSPGKGRSSDKPTPRPKPDVSDFTDTPDTPDEPQS